MSHYTIQYKRYILQIENKDLFKSTDREGI